MKQIESSVSFSSKVIDLKQSQHSSEISRRTAMEYQLRLQSLDMIKLLVHLCKDIQKHRGLSMGLLGGSQEFAARFDMLQKQITRRIAVINVFCELPKSRLNVNDRQRIEEAWRTVKEGWHDDSVLENFQFHTYFIEQLLQMISQLLPCLYLARSIPSSVSPSALHGIIDGAQQKDGLLNFVVGSMPSLIESLGMIRALATHCASQGHHNIEHDKKLTYLCQCLLDDKSSTIEIADQLYQQLGTDIPSLLVLKTYEFKVNGFLEKVKQEVIGQTHITMTSEELFTAATDIMEVYWRIVDDGIAVIYQYQDEALETWFTNE